MQLFCLDCDAICNRPWMSRGSLFQLLYCCISQLAVLMQHDFPGNVRELENIVEHAFVLCKKGIIHTRHLPDYLQPIGKEEPRLCGGCTLLEMEARLIGESLARNKWKRLATARELGIDKTTLWRKIKRLRESGLLNNI